MSNGLSTGTTYRVRPYRESDEEGWVRCRVLSFLDTSYRDDVQVYREEFTGESICLVAALENHEAQQSEIIGLIDIEIDNTPDETGNLRATIWSIAVLPEYRRKAVAEHLWQAAQISLKKAGVNTVEVWTQDDAPANHWYKKQGFERFHSYLNVYSRGPLNAGPMNLLLPEAAESWRYGHIRSFNFEAPLEHKEELQKLSYRIHEVRGYRLHLTP